MNAVEAAIRKLFPPDVIKNLRRRKPPYVGQHDWPHDEATCGRCEWLRWHAGCYRYDTGAVKK